MPIRTLSRYAPQFAPQVAARPVLIPFGEWTPDQAVLDSRGCRIAKNVIPVTARSYGPFPSATEYSAAVAAYVRGAFSGRDSSKNVANFCATAAKIYKSSGTSWTDETNVGGDYTTATEGYFEFAQFGDVVVATNLDDPIQAFTLGSSSEFADLDSSAPEAQTVAVIRDFLMVGNTNDSTDGRQPERVWWPAINNITNWPAPGSTSAAQVQSGYQNLPGTGYVQKIVAAVGGADGVVVCERGLWRISYEGPPVIFRFDQVEGARGTPIPRSPVAVGPFLYYIGEDDVYRFDGAQSVPIGDQKWAQYFWNDIDRDNLHRVTAVVDPIRHLVMWGYMSTTAGSDPDKILVHNWAINRTAIAELDHEILWRSTADGYTLETLDNLSSDLETLDISMDSPLLAAGTTNLSIFNTDHKWANLDGSPLAAEIETGEINGRGTLYYVDGIRPIADVDDGVSAAVQYRNTQDMNDTPASTPYTMRGADGVCHNRIEARFLRASVRIDAGAAWSHAQGVEPYQAGQGEI